MFVFLVKFGNRFLHKNYYKNSNIDWPLTVDIEHAKIFFSKKMAYHYADMWKNLRGLDYEIIKIKTTDKTIRNLV